MLPVRKPLEIAASGEVYLVRGGADYTGQATWYFVRVDSAKDRMFNKMIQSGSIDLPLYGKVLASGYGVEPPEALMARMRNDHGYAG